MDIFYTILAVICISTKLNGQKIENRPESIFPRSYDKFEPPSKNGEPAQMYVTLIILDIDSIDEEKLEYSVRIHFTEYWKDERLNLSSYKTEIKEPRIFSSNLVEHIWKPDLIFDNAKYGQLSKMTLPNTAIKVLEDGTFMKDSRYSVIVSCSMNLYFYPMDTQKCDFRIASLSFPDSKLLLNWSEEHPNLRYKLHSIFLPYKMNLLKYELTEVDAAKEVELWSEGNFTILVAKLTFSRRLTSAIFNVYLPSTLIILLSWISFWVDVQAVPARVTLGVTSLLTLTTQVVQVHSSLPPISYMTAMDIWLFGCLIGVFSVLVEFAFAYQFFHFKKETDTSGYDQQKDDARNKSAVRVLERRTGEKTKIQSTKTEVQSIPVISRWLLNVLKEDDKLDKISRKAFPISFFTFSLVYWVYFLSQSNTKREIATGLIGKL